MKELSIEEKAKAYDEAIKRVENIKTGKCKTTFMFTEGLFEHIFPELAESEDERVMRELIDFFGGTLNGEDVEFPSKDTMERWVAWLEKHGEQKKRLINKACDVLVDCIEDFMFRRMEVWSEECKKQTLENIRKTLEE